MDPCCGPPDSHRYDDIFDARFARDVARHYGAKGLSAVERRILDYVVRVGVTDSTILEIGGGVGELQLELLARGAARSVNLELSHEYETVAEGLIASAGVETRVRRLVGVDLALQPDAIDPADIVILNRVVCCYPEAERLLAAAAGRARRAIVFSHPPRNWLTRGRVGVENLLHGLWGRSYRGYIHRPQAMTDAVRRQGLRIDLAEPGFSWCVVGAVRSD